MMVSHTSPAIVLGPTGNIQGSYKLLNLATGKKIKCRQFTKYQMPDSVILKIETMGNQHMPGVFNFSDRNGVLFEWNDDVDKYNENIVEKNAILYPSLAVEFPGITLGRNVAVPSIEDDIFPHGLAKDAAAQNANAAPFVVQEWINGLGAIQANDNEIDEGEYDDKDNGIIEVADIPPGNAPLQNPIVAIPDSDEDAASTSKDLDSDDNEDKDPDFQDAHDQEDEGKKNEEEQEDDNIPGIRRLKCRNRGQTRRYADYGLMMAARRTARGRGQRR
jgi:hypothetical protein